MAQFTYYHYFYFQLLVENTFRIRIIMIVTGLFPFVSTSIAGKIFNLGVDKRLILAIEFFMFAF